MTFLITEANPKSAKKAGWSVELNGRAVQNAGLIRIRNDRFGTLSFGKRPEGTIGWGWQEVGGVGIVPYVIHKGKLHIGMVFQERPFLYRKSGLNIPRGFIDPNLPLVSSAERELREEVGLTGKWGKRLKLLEGRANANSTFFDTTEGEGFRYFILEVKPSEVEDVGLALRFKKSLIRRRKNPEEKIFGYMFMSWEFAASGPDNFTSSGVARLLAAKPELVKYL